MKFHTLIMEQVILFLHILVFKILNRNEREKFWSPPQIPLQHTTGNLIFLWLDFSFVTFVPNTWTLPKIQNNSLAAITWYFFPLSWWWDLPYSLDIPFCVFFYTNFLTRVKCIFLLLFMIFIFTPTKVTPWAQTNTFYVHYIPISLHFLNFFFLLFVFERNSIINSKKSHLKKC